MKRKYILAATVIVATTTFSSISASAYTGLVEKKFDVKADQIEDEIQVNHEGKSYLGVRQPFV